MKFDDPWIDGYIKKLEKENETLKAENDKMKKKVTLWKKASKGIWERYNNLYNSSLGE